MKIRWTNKYSGEQGFVKSLNLRGNYFVNTFDKAEARVYKMTSIERILHMLNNFCPDNVYEAVAE